MKGTHPMKLDDVGPPVRRPSGVDCVFSALDAILGDPLLTSALGLLAWAQIQLTNDTFGDTE